jgi:hypothetical protein
MISLAAAAKAGAVCLSLLSAEVQFCKLPNVDRELVCTDDGCRTPGELGRIWRRHPERQAKFYLKLYGAQ